MSIWDFVVQHWTELVFAVIFAIVFGVLADFVQPASRLRAAIRHLKNKLAEQSAARLRTRIAETERYRDRVAVYLASDKAHYLATLQFILGILLLMCMGAGVFLMGRLTLIPGDFELVALAPIAVAMVLAVSALRMASWDTRPKISEVIEKLDREIAGLKAKLNARTQLTP